LDSCFGDGFFEQGHHALALGEPLAGEACLVDVWASVLSIGRVAADPAVRDREFVQPVEGGRARCGWTVGADPRRF